MRLAPEFTSITGAPKHSPDGTLPAFMNCTLLLPNLLPHGEGAQAAWQAVDAPHLKQLLARAELTAGAGHGALDTLCRLFTLQRNAEHDWPLAPLLAIADGVDTALVEIEGAPDVVLPPENLALGRPVEVSSFWPGREKELDKAHITDGKSETTWAADEKARTASVTVDLQGEREVSAAMLSDAPLLAGSR